MNVMERNVPRRQGKTRGIPMRLSMGWICDAMVTLERMERDDRCGERT